MYWTDIESLIDRQLPPAVSVRVLASMFGFSPKFVGAMRHRPERYYRVFSIQSGSKLRQIHAPKVGLKIIQKWFSWYLSKAVQTSNCVFGFVAGRSAPMAAAVHCRANWVYSVDIENFFPTISAAMVLVALKAVGYPGYAAELLTDLCCYQGALSQGSPASPVISNLVCSSLDVEFELMANDLKIRFTRYADDIVFSGTGATPIGLPETVRSSIEARGWKIADGKERLTFPPQRLKVHGLLVHGASPRLTKGYRNRIRAISHLLKAGKVKADDIARFQGHIAYADSVNRISAT